MNKISTRTWILLLVFLMAVVGAGGWFGRKAYRKFMGQRFIAQARQYLDKKDWRTAMMCLRRTLQINPTSAEASKVVGDALEMQGLPTALGWRIRAAQLDPTRPEYRLEWANTALKLQEFKSAKIALDVLSQKDKDCAEYHKLAGALAWGLRDATEAERQYTQALQLQPTNLTVTMNLATIHLSSTNPAVAAEGRLCLERFATNDQLRIPALKQLATEAVARKSFPAAVDYAHRVVDSPGASFRDRIDYLQVLRESGSSDYSSYLAALKRDAVTNSAEVFAVGGWTVAAEGPTNALRWLRSLPANVQTNGPVSILIADCMASLKDWNSLLSWLDEQEWNEANYYRFALESLAHGSLEEDVAAKSAWQHALKLAYRRLDRLSHLAQFSLTWGREREKVEVLREITSAFPKEKWAVSLLVTQYYKDGNTQALAELLSGIYAADPSDPKLKNTLASVSLLRKCDLERAHRMAREAYDSAPDNPFFASTYAYSLLLQDKSQEALKVISEVKTNFLQIPTVAAYYGVVQARSGHKDIAREPLKLAEKSALLPEEKEIVQVARSQL